MAYVIKSGDSLSAIAARYGITLQELLAANPGKFPSPSMIYPGQVVNFPSDNRAPAVSMQAWEAQLPLPNGYAYDQNGAVIRTDTPTGPRYGVNPVDPNKVYPDQPVDPNPLAPPGTPPTIADPRDTTNRSNPTSRNPTGRQVLGPDMRTTPTGDHAFPEHMLGEGQYVTETDSGFLIYNADGTLSGYQTKNDTTSVVDAPPDSGTAPPPATGITPPPLTPDIPPPPDPQAEPPPEPIRSDFELQSSRAYLDLVLGRFGLGGLSGWAWGKIQAFVPDDQILLELREHPDYIKRFPGMKARQAAGLPAISEDQYIALERTYHQILRASGLPGQFYDDLGDYTQFISNDLSPNELQDRIEDGYRRVAQTDPAVRAAWEEFYGSASDGALAALFLDPDRAATVLVRQARTAEVAGIGRRAGVDIGEVQSDEIAAFAPSTAQISAGMGQVIGNEPFAQETFTELNDLQTGDLVAAAFNTSGASEARQAIRERRNKRLAAFSGGGGAAFFTGKGFVGTGVAGS